jgi:hypothetical protein
VRRFVEMGSVGPNGLASFRFLNDTRTVPSDPKTGVTSNNDKIHPSMIEMRGDRNWTLQHNYRRRKSLISAWTCSSQMQNTVTLVPSGIQSSVQVSNAHGYCYIISLLRIAVRKPTSACFRALVCSGHEQLQHATASCTNMNQKLCFAAHNS